MNGKRSDVQTFHHPGAGRRKAVPYPKGRQVDEAALAEVRRLLGDRPRRRDLLIEHPDWYELLSEFYRVETAQWDWT